MQSGRSSSRWATFRRITCRAATPRAGVNSRKSSAWAAAGIEAPLAGADRMRCSTLRASAAYRLSIMPENMPAPLVRNAGRLFSC